MLRGGTRALRAVAAVAAVAAVVAPAGAHVVWETYSDTACAGVPATRQVFPAGACYEEGGEYFAFACEVRGARRGAAGGCPTSARPLPRPQQGNTARVDRYEDSACQTLDGAAASCALGLPCGRRAAALLRLTSRADPVHECFSGSDGAATRVLQCSGSSQDVERSVASIVFTADANSPDLSARPVGVATCTPEHYVFLSRTRDDDSEVTLSWLLPDGAALGSLSTTSDPIVSGDGLAASTCNAAVVMGGVKLSGDLGTSADPPLAATGTTARDWEASDTDAVVWREGGPPPRVRSLALPLTRRRAQASARKPGPTSSEGLRCPTRDKWRGRAARAAVASTTRSPAEAPTQSYLRTSPPTARSSWRTCGVPTAATTSLALR